ncbi:hypothetical protein Goari_010196 [Gossypium aridum]|uniref:DUF4283 domain-containing protein n=1 Tax=Gossypium aridum TaxID=34290 RepID=A0A7J8XZB8_GOSAI|nr:hypothetical protein [Gossypium aridum]
MVNFLSDDDGCDESRSFEDCNTKKVKFKNGPDEAKVDMVVDLEPSLNMSWKDKLLRAGLTGSDKDLIEFGGGSDGDFILLEVLKLLGRSIGYVAFHNRISNLWKPLKPFQLMDIENGYYLEKLQNIEDYERVLTQGPWIIYDQYLTVQPWTKDFSPLQPYLSIVMAWIRLSGLPGFM